IAEGRVAGIEFPLEIVFTEDQTMRFFTSLSLATLALACLTAASQTTTAPKAPLAASKALAAQTPPMGWNSWNYFAERVTDKDIRAAADQLVSTGMKD